MAGPVYFDAFRRIIVQPDNITVSADAVDDTLTLVAGSGISIVANAGSDQLTIVNTGPGAATDWSAILNKPEAAFNIAGDDSTQKAIGFGELVKFTGVSNITVTTDAEGNVTVTGPDLSGYLTAETDPVYTGSSWYSTTNNSANWDAAYSWGDHALAGYLTSAVDSDDITVGSIRINTNVIQTVDSNADLELDANGTGAVSVIGNLKVSGNIATTSNQIAIGNGAGSTSQGTYAVAVGYAAGQTNQGLESTALGQGAGYINQGIFAVALGSNAGQLNQGNYAVSIGHNAGFSSQPASSIVINATGNLLNGSAAGLFVDPIRQVDTGLLLRYNTTTKEIIYSNDDITVGSISIENNLIKTTVSNADLELDANGSGTIQLRSNLKLSDGTSPDGEWINFTPTWTGSTTNPTIGDGLIEGRYKQVGKTVDVWMMMTAGSTTTFGTGEYKVSLPVNARAIASVVLSLVMYDNGTRHYNSLAHNDYTTGSSLDNASVTLFWDTGVVTNTAPFTWANGDWFIVSGTYEAA